MVLGDRDIKVLLTSGDLIVEPLDDPESRIRPSSINLSLSSKFVVFKSEQKLYIDPFNDNPREFAKKVVVSDGEPFVIHLSKFVPGATKKETYKRRENR